LLQRLRRLSSRGRDACLRAVVARRWASRRHLARAINPHNLPAPVVVSLTSFPGRYHTLALTLHCLLLQSKRPDHVVLWIAEEHQAALPEEVLALRSEGLTIGCCDNSLRSHNKYIHTRRLYPDAFIATADDDTYYWPSWLEELIADYDPRRRVIPCHRVHRIVEAADGTPVGYCDWQWEHAATEADALVFPTGVGGVLYPPGSLHADVDDAARILELCPRADDVWLYWMARRQDYLFRRGTVAHRLHHWRHSQEEGLMWGNVYDDNGNDRQIAAMIAAFGWPVSGIAPSPALQPAAVAAGPSGSSAIPSAAVGLPPIAGAASSQRA
jgi:hypothetical protein